jgi:hypothetical protein
VFSAQTTTGATALFVGANGNVGIGTTSPTSQLHVYTLSGAQTQTGQGAAQIVNCGGLPLNINYIGPGGGLNYSIYSVSGTSTGAQTSKLFRYLGSVLSDGNSGNLGGLHVEGIIGGGGVGGNACYLKADFTNRGTSGGYKYSQLTGGTVDSTMNVFMVSNTLSTNYDLYIQYGNSGYNGFNLDIKSIWNTFNFINIEGTADPRTAPTSYTTSWDLLGTANFVQKSATGNVGIGTTNPNAKLDVRGSSNILGVINSGPSLFVNGNPNEFGLDSLIKITTSGGGQNNSAPYVNRAFLELQSNTAQGNFNYNMISVTRNAGTPGEAKYAHITGDGSAYFAGNVGIGTNAPAYKLEVIGIGNMIAATNLQSTVTQMLGTSTTIGFTGTKTNHNTYIVSNNGAGGNIVLNAAGTAFFPLSGSTCELGGASNRWSTIYAVNALNTSDRNLKENISDAPLGIDFVNALNPKTFTWKEYTQTVVNPVTDEPRTVTKPAGTRLQYGLIAQDVKDVLDKFGIDSKDFAGYVDSTVNEPDKPQVLYLNYIQFIPILIKSVKELSAENTTLKQSLASMESRLAALEARG